MYFTTDLQDKLEKAQNELRRAQAELRLNQSDYERSQVEMEQMQEKVCIFFLFRSFAFGFNCQQSSLGQRPIKPKF